MNVLFYNDTLLHERHQAAINVIRGNKNEKVIQKNVLNLSESAIMKNPIEFMYHLVKCLDQ